MLFQPSRPGEPEYSKSTVETYILGINGWMTANKLKLHNEKTEFIGLIARRRPPPQPSSIYVGSR